MERCRHPSDQKPHPTGQKKLEELVLADTDVIIDFFNGISPSAETIAALVSQDRLAITSISVFELYAGVTGKRRIEAIDLLLRNVVLLPLEEKAAREAGKIFVELKAGGRLIGNEDTLIAAIARTHDLPVLTRNKGHFSRVKGLALYEEPTEPPETRKS